MNSIAKVAIPVPRHRLFHYAVPEKLRGCLTPGMRVAVPFGRQEKIGIVVELTDSSEVAALKELSAVLDAETLLPPRLMDFILWGAKHYLTPPGEAFRAVLPPLFWKAPRKKRSVQAAIPAKDLGKAAVTLNQKQDEVATQLWQTYQSGSAGTALLHGITASGKTEVYLELARRILAEGRSVLLLVPEIALTPQLFARCSDQVPVTVGAYHSGLTARQREQVWEDTRAGELRMVVGTRSALFLPLDSLGLIIVDEEHDSSFKQEERFRYNARDLAVVRGRTEKALVILGSATPSLESYQRCREEKYQLLELPERASGGRLPEINFVDLRTQEETSLLSSQLTEAIDDVVQRGEQCLLFLNRRGFSPVQLCFDCGSALECPHCRISLTLHKKEKRLLCHYCLYQQKESQSCKTCGSSRIGWVGWGTERVEQEIAERFPRARTARLDRDTTQRRGALNEVLSKMHRREIDILIGTQILTKGHDYPGVTLVGILLAESSLNFPDFRAAERTNQLITQVSGRAGRGTRPGRVLVQGFNPDHYALKSALAHDYRAFFDEELALRRQLHYPPFDRMIQIVYRAKTERAALQAAENGTAALAEWVGPLGDVMGPAPCPIEKLRNQYRWQSVIKTHQYGALRERLQSRLDEGFRDILASNVTVTVDVDPLNML